MKKGRIFIRKYSLIKKRGYAIGVFIKNLILGFGKDNNIY